MLGYIALPLSRAGFYRELVDKWLPPALESQNENTRARALNAMGFSYDMLGEYDKALPCYEQALEIFRKAGKKSEVGTLLNNISQIYDARGDYEKALSYLEQALEISKATRDKAGLCVTLFNMGHIYLKNEEIEKALKTWAKVYSIAKPMQLAETLNDLKKLAKKLGLPGGLDGWKILSELGLLGISLQNDCGRSRCPFGSRA